MEELIDIYDEDLHHIGVATRTDVHAKGYWHKTFHCWVAMVQSGIPFVVLQKRHPTKDTNPNKLDVSCAGHLSAGEQVSDGVRELHEELGLAVAYEELHPIGVIHVEARCKDILDFEACHVFAHVTECKLEDLRPQVDEVSGLYLARLTDVIALFTADATSIELKGYEVSSSGERVNRVYRAETDDFVSHTHEYYVDTLTSISRLVAETT
ncbi:NUDIX domain-containing protein [Alicyclobacillus fastidiosus]|uniref:NUDIX domain-containing protein n=1 Tax=Alicyclobacillus fastidiosus TaxID=392011 RepID=A0ABY6ZGJ7_9BACL|nr:NUDIX domain-containing protein [Alicyclobacillus fastidiosus]WAH41967.1 NUDIX domain-containing protein [Alicyclobacillus fastidiosus]GMA63692.1 putative Nudix hydrolase [Alicyclobacillus fastidiosus]